MGHMEKLKKYLTDRIANSPSVNRVADAFFEAIVTEAVAVVEQRQMERQLRDDPIGFIIGAPRRTTNRLQFIEDMIGRRRP